MKNYEQLIPRQQFDIPIQAAIGAKIISRETIKAVKKRCNGEMLWWGYKRKRKLLERQKKGKKKMRQVVVLRFLKKRLWLF